MKRDNHILHFTFPKSAQSAVVRVCLANASGFTWTPAIGVWVDDDRAIEQEELLLGIVSVAQACVTRLQQQIERVLTETGEKALWITGGPVHGGVAQLRSSLTPPTGMRHMCQNGTNHAPRPHGDAEAACGPAEEAA